MATAGIFPGLYSILDLGVDRNTNFDKIISTIPCQRRIHINICGGKKGSFENFCSINSY